ncbi:atos homolog protein A-like [Uloborus diversus]|uniref:atos homolog protein A-like n=1 Tax=Uloborus diversus TaxID=327109 RepID=UPI002409163A|nr:atos homolog protein A-like [Uloborus diversus]
MSELCESRLKPCPGEREPVLRKLYIDLCNLIVESRIPGIDDRGYGEGIHCPPLMGPNTHCCDLSVPECQKHQKLIHRLLRSMKRNIFDVEVFMLPDCCRETKLAERIPKKEYVLLEQWSFNCFHGSKLQSSIDVPQLLRAVRSFLYFSQISAWLSSNEGKSPSNIYYWVRPSSEVSTAKFENEPELHRFPLCKIYEGLYGTIEVRYRTRTQYVPIIPCSKHPPQENPLITVIDNSDVCQTICLGSHIVRQLHKTCDTIHESPVSDKTITEPISNVLMPANMPQVPVVKAICGDVPDNISKAKGILKHSNCQIYSESVFGLVPKLQLNVDSDKNLRKSIKPLNSILDEDVIIRHSSSKNLSQRHNLTLPLKGGIKQRKLSRELLDSSSTDTDFSSLDSLPSSATKSKRKRHSSKAFITNSKVSLICSSNSKILQLSSPICLEDGNDGCDGSNATTSDAINNHNLNKMKSCHFSEQNSLPNKVSLPVDVKKRDTEFSLGSKNSLNLSQHSIRLCIENNWNDEKFSPISSKIIVSKCEPLPSQESSVPNRTKKSCRGIKRKASKCVHNCKYLCNCKNSKRKTDVRATIEKDIPAPLDSESNISLNFVKPNNDKILLSKPEQHAESRKKNFKHKRMKKEIKAISPATATVNSTYANKSLEDTLASSKPNSDSNNDSSKITPTCNLATENKHSACNQYYLCSEDEQSKCLESFPIETINNLERRTFRKRKRNEKNDSYAKLDGEVSDTKILFSVDEPCPFSDSNEPSKLKNRRGITHNRRRKKTAKLSARAESKLQSLCKCSLANSKVILEQNLECCNEKRAVKTEKLYEAEVTTDSILNTSQNSKTELNSSCISNPNMLVDVSIATEKSFKNNIQIQEKKCDFNTSKTKVQLAAESASETEKNTYPSASNKLICDYTLKHDRLKSYETANLYSEKEVDCFAVWKLNRKEDLSATKLKKGRRLLLNFEESILAGCLEPVKTVIGYKVEIGASGSFCPDHLTLPADVSFYELKSSHQHTVPYRAHVTFEDIEYYLPKKGSMQVTLFNPSETVVKMFVLNYDLSNMPPLHHTFIRQKTYYMPVDAADKDPKWLRYIIHLRFASSKTGRIFLHKDFKIVVLNRSNDDAACDHIQQPCELRSFLSVPKNPAFSSL